MSLRGMLGVEYVAGYTPLTNDRATQQGATHAEDKLVRRPIVPTSLAVMRGVRVSSSMYNVYPRHDRDRETQTAP